MKTIKIKRSYQNDKQSLGVCSVFDEDNRPLFSGLSLERGWLDNLNNISCVPVGEYELKYEFSNSFNRELWELKGVPGRSECKFHAANYWHQLRGCISLGSRLMDIDKDGFHDVTSSGNTMLSFHLALKGETKAKLIIS